MNKSGGIPELIEDGKNGFLYKSNCIFELKEKMQELFINDEEVNEFSNNSRKLYERNYSPNTYYDKLIKVYNTLRKQK